MILQQISVFEPTKFAYFPNSQYPCIQIHPSLQYISFSTRNNQLILYNKNTGRTSNIFKSEHGIVDVKFTNDLILVIEKGYHQIVCISLKTQKIKKKITGNRSQIFKISYCRQRGLFAVITNQTCSIYNQFTLSREKVLKCSTSYFYDCYFNSSGQYLFTSFKDSTFFIWNLQDFTYEQHAMQDKKLKITSNYSSFICAYSNDNILIADLSKQIIFQKIQKFWDSKIQKVDFIENIIIIQTSSTFFIAELSLQHKFVCKNIKAVQGTVTTFRVGSYGSIILLLSKNAKKISCLQIVDQKKNIIGKAKNPLQNQGLNCCGGYSNINGCIVSDDIYITQSDRIQYTKTQLINKNIYNDNTTTHFSQQKLQQFIRKHHIFPDKHRSASYKFLLKLPINPEQFLKIQQKGWHQSVQFLQKKYPLQNKKIAQTMKNIISWLAWIDPIYGEWQNTAMIVFPFVCMFGQDQYFCFQIVYRVFTNFLSFVFDEFPVANSKFLQNFYEIMQQSDPQILRHIKSKNITFTKLSWSLLSTFFTSNLPKQTFLAVLDNVISHPNQPQFIIFILLGYLSYNKSRILSINNENDLERFLQQEHSVNTGKFLNYVYVFYESYKSKVHYKFEIIDLNQKNYMRMNNYPKDAVKMIAGRRKILAQQFRKQDKQQFYKQKLTQQMKKMTIQAKRNSQRQMIRAESFSYHIQNEQKSRSYQKNNLSKENVKLQKIKRLQQLIRQLSQALKNQKDAKNIYKQNISYSISTNLHDRSDRELQQLQLKLLKQLSNLKPSLVKPFSSIPASGFKDPHSLNNSNAFKALMNAQIANKMWEVDSLDNINKEQSWSNDMLRSMKA